MSAYEERPHGMDPSVIAALVPHGDARLMSDDVAVTKVDELRALSRTAARDGNVREARALLHGAAQVAEANYVCLEAIDEYADMLDDLGHTQYAREYRQLRRDIDDAIATAGRVPAGYEDRLRSGMASASREDGGVRVAEAVGQARAASTATVREPPLDNLPPR